MLAKDNPKRHYMAMPEGAPPSPNELRDFYSRIAPIVESVTGMEAQMTIREWNPRLLRDIRSEAEMLMLLHGQSVSDRFLYGFCSAVVAIREENGSELPELTDRQYEMDREIQDSHQAAQDPAAAEYFSRVERLFESRFPLTSAILEIMEHDLRSRLRAREEDIQEGFIPGWYKAIKVAMPLFME